MKGTLQFIHCDSCGKGFLVGINGKDVRGSNSVAGEFVDIPYVGFGNEDLAKAPPLDKEAGCPICGKACEVEHSKPQEAEA